MMYWYVYAQGVLKISLFGKVKASVIHCLIMPSCFLLTFSFELVAKLGSVAGTGYSVQMYLYAVLWF